MKDIVDLNREAMIAYREKFGERPKITAESVFRQEPFFERVRRAIESGEKINDPTPDDDDLI